MLPHRNVIMLRYSWVHFVGSWFWQPTAEAIITSRSGGNSMTGKRDDNNYAVWLLNDGTPHTQLQCIPDKVDWVRAELRSCGSLPCNSCSIYVMNRLIRDTITKYYHRHAYNEIWVDSGKCSHNSLLCSSALCSRNMSLFDMIIFLSYQFNWYVFLPRIYKFIYIVICLNRKSIRHVGEANEFCVGGNDPEYCFWTLWRWIL